MSPSIKPDKPRVKYDSGRGYVKWGRSVILYPIDHPSERVTNQGKGAITSPVQSISDEGVIETANTIYEPS